MSLEERKHPDGESSADAAPAVFDEQQTAAKRKAAYEINKLSKRLHRQVGSAIIDYNMIEDGDKVMVCLSGGKDSYTMLDILLSAARTLAPVNFELVAVNLDQKQPRLPRARAAADWLRARGIPFHIEEQDTYSIVKRVIEPEGKTMCSLCSRLRRGILYRVAGELGCDQDRARPSSRRHCRRPFFMNMFFGAKLKGMPPKLSERRRQEHRDPPARLRANEVDLVRWAEHGQFPIIPCTLCGSQDNLQRVQIKAMIREWDKQYPGRIENIFTAMANITPSHMMDRQLFPFTSIKASGQPEPDGDIAFDEDESCATPKPGVIRIV